MRPSILCPRVALALAGGVALAIPTTAAHAQSDNFDDGDADGWTELIPLMAVGGSGSFSFPNGNSYRMQSDPSPNEGSFGAARIGALREDVTYDDFYVCVDLVDYDESLDQNIGILARVRDPGLGTLDGYAASYNPTDGQMFLTVVTDEAGPDIDAAVFVPVGEPVRLVFQGSGGQLKFEIFRLDDLENPAGVLEMTDFTYASGTCGLFAVSDGADPPLPTDCTFDNYIAAAEEPNEFRIVGVEQAGDNLNVEFLSKLGATYSLWTSDDLSSWAEVDDGITGEGATTTVSVARGAGHRMYYQLRRVD